MTMFIEYFSSTPDPELLCGSELSASAREGFFQLNSHLDGIMHKWSNPHFDDFEKKSRCNMKYRIKRINTN